MITYIIALYFALTFTGIFFLFIHYCVTGIAAYGSLVAANGSLLLGTCMFALNTLSVLMTSNDNSIETNPKKNPNSKPSIFGNVIYLIIMLGTVGFQLYMLLAFKNKILSGNYPNGYWRFNNVFNLCILIQSCIVSYVLLYNYTFSSLVISTLSLFGLINIIVSKEIFNILKYFTADGFSSMSMLNRI